MAAKAPTRKTFSATIGWGMVSIPVGFFTATEESGISRSQFVRVGEEVHPVGNKRYDKVTGDEVAYGDIVKMLDTGEGLVELSDSEMEQVLQPDNGVASIIEFRPVEEWESGRYVYTSMMQVRPDKVGTGKNKKVPASSNKAFALLLESMKSEGVFALVEIVTRGRSRFAAFTAEGRAYFLHYDEEVREELPLPEVELTDKELTMGRKLIKTAKSRKKNPPELANNDAEKVMKYATDKVKGKAEVPAEAAAEPVDDLAAMLEASLAASK